MLKKILLTLVMLLLVLLVLFNYTAIPESFDQNSQSAELMQLGDYPVVMQKLTAVDELRTVPDKRVKGQTLPRSIDYRVCYPDVSAVHDQAAKPMPLVLYSHGMMGNYDEGLHYAKHFVSHGYVFVAPNFPLSTMSNGQRADSSDVINQPADISFLLDLLLERNQDSTDPLYRLIDTDKIVAMGLSLGGMTTHMLGYDTKRIDNRIDALVAVAAPSEMFSAKYFATRSLPYLGIASPQDAFIDYPANALPVLEKIAQSVLLTIDGGSHTGYAYQSRWLRWLDNPDSIGCDQVKKNLDSTLDEGDSLYAELGSVEQSYIVKTDIQICESVLTPAMNPIRQNELTLLAAWSFLQCQFSTAPQPYCTFLSEGMAAEHSSVSYREGSR